MYKDNLCFGLAILLMHLFVLTCCFGEGSGEGSGKLADAAAEEVENFKAEQALCRMKAEQISEEKRAQLRAQLSSSRFLQLRGGNKIRCTLCGLRSVSDASFDKNEEEFMKHLEGHWNYNDCVICNNKNAVRLGHKGGDFRSHAELHEKLFLEQCPQLEIGPLPRNQGSKEDLSKQIFFRPHAKRKRG